MKKISIIIPIYNMEDKLERCLNSIVNQTYKNIECILINDGSKDNSLKIIKSYIKKHPDLFKLIDRENRGISASRNEGIVLSSGEYIAFVDSDDYIENNMLFELQKKIESNKSDIAVCDYFTFSDKNNKLLVKVGANIKFPTSLKKQPNLITDIDFAPWNKLYKKELFKDIRFPLNKKYEDINAILKVFLLAKKIDKIDLPLYDYYINSNGESSTFNEKSFDIIYILEDLISYYKKQNAYNERIKKQFEILSIKKLFYYLNCIETLEYSNFCKFIDMVFNYFNTNFTDWKKMYKFIYYSDNFKTNLIYKIKGNKTIYKLYIKFKRK